MRIICSDISMEKHSYKVTTCLLQVSSATVVKRVVSNDARFAARDVLGQRR